MTQRESDCYWKLALSSSLAIAGAITFHVDHCLGQVERDSTLGAERSIVTPDVIKGLPSARIDGGAIRGANLFHSFQEFSVDAGRGAYFTNPLEIKNILGRVTGNNPSDIQGTLGVLGSANLFLINSNGIIFGPNASLDLRGGSFLASTASSVKFADNAQFSVVPQTKPLLITSIPIGLQFGSTAVGIHVQGSELEVQPGKTLGLVGGDVTLEGRRLKAPGGRIELGSVASNSLVSLNPKSWSLGYKEVQNFQDIQLKRGKYSSLVDASGESGGDISLQGRQVLLTGGSQIFSSTDGEGPGGNLIVNASESLAIIGADSLLSTSTTSRGDGGKIKINTKRLLVDGGYILTDSAGFVDEFGQITPATGQGGDLTIITSESVELINGGSASSLTQDIGDAGDVTINTRRLIIQNGSDVTVSSLGTGDAGNIKVTAGSIFLDNKGALTAETTTSGMGGDIKLKARDIRLQRESNISTTARTERGPGDGGNITINTDTLIGLENSDITANANQGRGGFIDITAQGIFGLKVRAPNENTSDISAISEKDPSLNGVVQINTPDVDPDEGVVALPEQVVDVSRLVAQSCPVGGSAVARGRNNRSFEGTGSRQISPNQFVATGRGGLPPTPKEALKSDTVLVDLGTPMVSAAKPLKPLFTSAESSGQAVSEEPLHRAKGHTGNNADSASGNLTRPAATTITEAQGWVRRSNGQVVLTVQAPPDRSGLTSAACHGF